MKILILGATGYLGSQLRKLYSQEARVLGTYNENINLIKKKYFNKTEKQLRSWGLKYHKLYMGKPSFDIYVDDKSLNFSHNWLKQLKKKLNFK